MKTKITETPKPPGMKQFTRRRTLAEIEAICKARKWKLHTKKFEQGSDFVSFDFKIKTPGSTAIVKGTALFSTVNGWIFGNLESGEQFNSNETTHENQPWFQTLLETAYAA